MCLPSVLSSLGALALVLALAACGGGDTAPPATPADPAPLAPVVVSTAITTPVLSGARVVACGNGVTCADVITEADGVFSMVLGGSLDVRVGPLTVLSAKDTSRPVTSVMAFSATGDETDPTFINQMTLLYSLDADADPSNGISLAAKAHAAIASQPYRSIRFDVAPAVFVANPVVQATVDAINAVEDAPGVSLAVRDPARVKETVRRLLFDARWGGTWALRLDDAAASTVTLTVAPDGVATVSATNIEFPLQLTTPTEADLRFSGPSVGSFIGRLTADGSGRGTWSRSGSAPSAGFWTAARSTAAPN